MGETQTSTTDVAKPRRDVRSTAAFILTGLSGGHGVFHWFVQSFLVMLPEIRTAFGLNPIQVGAIATTREVASGIVSLPGGILIDLFRRHWGLVLAASMAAFGLGWLIIGLAPVYALVLVGISFVAVSASIWHLPAQASLSHRFSHRRGSALSLHAIGGNIGDVLGPILTGVLLGYLAWQRLLSIYAVIPLFLTFVVFWAFANIGKGQKSSSSLNLKAQLGQAVEVWKKPVLMAINLVAGLRGMAFVAFTTFLPLYMKDELGMSSRLVGAHIGLLVAVGIIATPTLGYVSDRLGRKPILVPSLIGLCILSFMLVTFGQGLAFTLLIALLGLFLYSDQPILQAAALDMVGENVATTTLGALSFSRFVLAAVSPIVAGFLYQTRGIDATFYYAAGLFALAAVALSAIRLKEPRHVHTSTHH